MDLSRAETIYAALVDRIRLVSEQITIEKSADFENDFRVTIYLDGKVLISEKLSLETSPRLIAYLVYEINKQKDTNYIVDEMLEGWKHFLGTINMGASYLDAEAISFMNEFGLKMNSLKRLPDNKSKGEKIADAIKNECGINLVTCGKCGGLFSHKVGFEGMLTCIHCGYEDDQSMFPDFFY